MKNKQVLYVTWGEVITGNGIFRNQVMEQLRLIKQKDHSVDITLLSVIPINTRIAKAPWQFFKELKSIGEKCQEDGICFRYKMHFVPSPWFYTPVDKMKWFDLGQYQFIKKIIKRIAPNVVHCRSYQSTRLFLTARKKFDLLYKVVFDTRGNFPEEGYFKKHLSGTDFRIWKQIEKSMLEDADAVVNVSGTFTSFIRKIVDKPSIHTIYTSTNTSVFRHDPEQGDISREKLGILPGQKVLAYLGELSPLGWHNPSRLLLIYEVFREYFGNTRLLVITLGNPELFIGYFTRAGIPREEIVVAKGNSLTETNAYLNAADFTAMPFREVDDEVTGIIGFTMVGSKTGEYLAAGKPVLVNAMIGEGTDIVRRYGVGAVYEPGKEQALKTGFARLAAIADLSLKCTKVANELFSAEGNAEKYLNIYDQLTRDY